MALPLGFQWAGQGLVVGALMGFKARVCPMVLGCPGKMKEQGFGIPAQSCTVDTMSPGC